MKRGILLSVVGMLFIGGGSASALVTFPNTGTIGAGEKFILSADDSRVFTVDANGSKAYDLETGARQQDINQDMRDFTVSDDATRHVALTDEGFEVYDAKLKITEPGNRTLTVAQEEVTDFSAVAFLPGTHTVVFLADKSSEGKLIGYDLDKKIVTFVRGTQQFGELLASDQYIFVKADESVYVYTHDGMFYREITPSGTSFLHDMDVTRDGLLVVAGDTQEVRVYDGKNGFKSAASGTFMTSTQAGVRSVAVDSSGTYIASLDEEEHFRLFDRAGQRIYTSLDPKEHFTAGPIALTNHAKTIMIGVGEQTNLYAGRTVIERTAVITIPKTHATIEKGKKETLQLSVKRFDGKTVTVRSGVRWSSTSKAVQIKKGVLYGVKPGSYTLKAVYEGRTVTLKGNVKQASLASLSDVEWLKRHWASIGKNGTFEGANPFSAPFYEIKGVQAAIGLENSESVFRGPLVKGILYTNAETAEVHYSNRIQDITLIPSLLKRNIDQKEVMKAFGTSYGLKKSKSASYFLFDIGKERNNRFGIYSLQTYHSARIKIDVYYDKNKIARFFSVSRF